MKALKKSRANIAAAMLAICLSGVIFQPAAARTLEVGQGKAFPAPSDAIAAASDGDHILIYPGEYIDCAVVHTRNLVVEGSSDPQATVLTDKACQGKALLVIAAADVTVRNITLARVRVPDGNGAGIRAEGSGNLLVENVHFINNQNGLLAAKMPEATITIRNSAFERNGVCNPGCAHGVYVGGLSLLRIENSRFFETKQGHHIKSRASRTEIINCDIQDGEHGTSSYLIDVPNGGSLVVRGSKLQKGPDSENHTAAIMIGAEGVTNKTNEITIENNTFRNDGSFDTYFVNNITATEAHLKGNQISGRVLPLKGDGDVDGRPPPRKFGMKATLRSAAGWGAEFLGGTPLIAGLVGASLVLVLVRLLRAGGPSGRAQ